MASSTWRTGYGQVNSSDTRLSPTRWDRQSSAGAPNLIAAIKSYAERYFATHGTYQDLAILLTGYSQGAMVVDQVWVLDILAANGVLNHLLPNILLI
jgi:hypothetical protein